ncbi:hypothetical protein B0T21DRAFT_382525 [Apiosordaria backusii]|uniref:F-box domain-containing protein n=1 Tax=Apiosordaria backusii TaxID=314023 RepID=A0AA40BSF2_9PEZI|nr:hypothetical protein B0T21DRAFT_382525 [Apiosordaria backusii]
MADPIATPNAINPQEDSFLACVPVEVLLRITRWIPTVDLANVRLTCKILERNLFNSFAHEFFRKKQFMVSTPSLQALIDISKHSTLSPFLKHVIICTDRPNDLFMYNPPNVDQKMVHNLRRAQADQANLISMGLLPAMLAEAFSALPSLEVIDLRDFNSRSRNRDGINAEWRSYGSVSLREATGVGLSAPGGLQDVFPTQIFTAIIAALAASGSQPDNIEVLLRHRSWGLLDSAFAIPAQLEPKLAPILGNLKTLHLSFCIQMESFMIQDFLTMARNVSWLRLNFNSVPRISMEEPGPAMFKWLEHPETDTPISNHDRRSVSFPNLKRFDIGHVDLAAKTILKLVAKFSPTLKHLSLRRVFLIDTPRDLEEKLNPWAGLFKLVTKIRGIQLSVLELSDLQHGRLDHRPFRGPITFKTGTPTSPYHLHVNNYFKGTTDRMSLEALVENLAEEMICPWPPRSHVAISDSEMDVDSDEDEDADEDDGEELDDDE